MLSPPTVLGFNRTDGTRLFSLRPVSHKISWSLRVLCLVSYAEAALLDVVKHVVQCVQGHIDRGSLAPSLMRCNPSILLNHVERGVDFAVKDVSLGMETLTCGICSFAPSLDIERVEVLQV
jgi:hypothetical protein